MKWKPYANIAIALFVVFQLLYPIRGFRQSKSDSWGAFTWNMYAVKYGCKSIYYMEQPDGQKHSIDVRRYFTHGDKTGKIFHRDVLPQFNEWLCEQLQLEGRTGILKATCECWTDEDNPHQLIAPDTEICTAPNYGVVADSL